MWQKIFTKATAKRRNFVFTGIALRAYSSMTKFCDRNCKYISCWPRGDVCCNIWGVFNTQPTQCHKQQPKQAPRHHHQGSDFSPQGVAHLFHSKHVKFVISPNARNSIASFVVVEHLNKEIEKNLSFPRVNYLHATNWVTYKLAQDTSPVILPVSSIMETTDQQTKMNSGSAAVVSMQFKHETRRE